MRDEIIFLNIFHFLHEFNFFCGDFNPKVFLKKEIKSSSLKVSVKIDIKIYRSKVKKI